MPIEACADWLVQAAEDALDLNDAKALAKALHGHPPIKAEKPKASRVEIDWAVFRAAIREKGAKTSRFGILSKQAISEGLGPRELDRNWVLGLASSMSQKERASLNMVLKQLEDLRVIATFPKLLPKEALGVLPDQRRNGRKALPAAIRREFDQILDGEDYAYNTLRYKRSCLSALYNEAYEMDLLTSNEPCRSAQNYSEACSYRCCKERGAKLLPSR